MLLMTTADSSVQPRVKNLIVELVLLASILLNYSIIFKMWHQN